MDKQLTSLEKLESAIRQALPELMELSEVPPLMKKTMGKYNLNIEPNYKHDVNLLHLLRWLDIVEIQDVWMVSMTMDGEIETINGFAEVEHYKLDLSRPLLSQQSEEVINELVKLLK